MEGGDTMKIQWNKKYTKIALYSVVTAVICALVVFLLINISSVFAAVSSFLTAISPIVIAFITAYVLNPLVKTFEKLLRGKKKNIKSGDLAIRVIAIVISYILVIGLVALFVWLVIPQVIVSYNDLVLRADNYAEYAKTKISEFISGLPIYEEGAAVPDYLQPEAISEKVNDIIVRLYSMLTGLTGVIISYAGTLVKTAADMVIGVAISVYFLIKKEKIIDFLKKCFYRVLPEKRADSVLGICRMTDRTFGGFLVAKVLDSIIIGLITFIILAIVDMPYYPLISVVMTVTNMIPYFGPFIGAIPSGLLVLIAKPSMVIWFALIILTTQQIDGNFICPKIVGESIGIRSLWVIIAITVMGSLFGLPGLLLGEPIFAVFYFLTKRFVDYLTVRKEKAEQKHIGAGGGL